MKNRKTKTADKESLLSLAELRDRLSYDPLTGKFVWIKTKRSDRIGSEAGCMNSGYHRISIMGQFFLTHRLAWFYVHGVWPRQIDHADRDTSNNRISNLRQCTNAQNTANRAGRAKVGLKGAYSSGARFRSVITRSGVQTYLGTFDTAAAAHTAYMSAARRLYGEFAAS